MLNLNSILIFSEHPSDLVGFYSKVFQKAPDWGGGDFKGFAVGNGRIAIGPHDKVHGVNLTPERMIFNLETSDVDTEFGRIKEIGARVVQAPYSPSEAHEMKIATFADPDGNYFQLATPIEM